MAHSIDGAFHAHDGWYFQRLPDEQQPGTVRITHINGDGDPLEVDFDPNTWASIVASVSQAAETSDTFDRALELHQDMAPSLPPVVTISPGRYIQRENLIRILDQVEAS